MSGHRPKFTVCIPAYNRAKYLSPLLDSILAQDYRDFDIVICEDCSAERLAIAEIVIRYASRYPGVIHYYENESNLGYDANIRNLIAKSTGQFCFFMGNDDLMCPGALANVAALLERHENIGVVLKSYAWFDEVPEIINQEVRYFSKEQLFKAGKEAITICFRRSGVISGYIVDRDAAFGVATDEFDGTLYYQMHLTAAVLSSRSAVATPEILVVCRNKEAPEFGNSAKEVGMYTPGTYTPQARLSMMKGVLSIIKAADKQTGWNISSDILPDYANYFYPYIKDQLTLPLMSYISLCYRYGKLGFYKYPIFYFYCLAGYVLGERRFDSITRRIRKHLGRSPQFGLAKVTHEMTDANQIKSSQTL